MCRERVYRTVLVDTDIPNVDCAEFVRDLRILQSNAVFIGLVMRANKDTHPTATELGFASQLVKPFDAQQLEEFIDSHFSDGGLLNVDGNVIAAGPFKGSAAAAEVFFRRLQQTSIEAASQAAAACHDRLIVNATQIPVSPTLTKFFLRLQTHCAEIGISLKVVGSPELAKLLQQLVETAQIQVLESVDAAKAA
jgi:DNA-binding response OmpR family regulator